ncbi:MAG: hypothetical protein ACI9V1_001902 [Spirosomataceae bacterium]
MINFSAERQTDFRFNRSKGIRTAGSPQIKGLNATVQGSLSMFWEEKQAFGEFDKGFYW